MKIMSRDFTNKEKVLLVVLALILVALAYYYFVDQNVRSTITAADAECIIMLMEFYKRMGFDPKQLTLRINSMGDAACRPAYRQKVRDFILDHKDEMCEDCLERAEINPLRSFDCKNDHCREVMADAPLAKDNLCDDCAAHYAKVKQYLDEAGIDYVEDPTLVRGLDYYTRTVFEVECESLFILSENGLNDIRRIKRKLRNSRKAKSILVHIPIERIRPLFQAVACRNIIYVVNIKITYL